MCFGGFHPAKNVEVPPTPVGGAPPREINEMFGTDGREDSAGNAVQEAMRMIDRLREMQKR
jgi:hypothetical protein